MVGPKASRRLGSRDRAVDGSPGACVRVPRGVGVTSDLGERPGGGRRSEGVYVWGTGGGYGE